MRLTNKLQTVLLAGGLAMVPAFAQSNTTPANPDTTAVQSSRMSRSTTPKTDTSKGVDYGTATTGPVGASAANDNEYAGTNTNTGTSHNFGWIGLIGLAGLAGLAAKGRRDTRDMSRMDTTTRTDYDTDRPRTSGL